MHSPQAVGITVAKAVNGSPDLLVLFGRLANVIFYAIAVIFFIIRFVMIGKWHILWLRYSHLWFIPPDLYLLIPSTMSLSWRHFAYIINLFTQSKTIEKNQFITLEAFIRYASKFFTKQTNLVLLLLLAALPVKLFKKMTLASSFYSTSRNGLP